MMIQSTTARRAQKKACCRNCQSGKPCCGTTKPRPAFERRRGLWLPRRDLTLPKNLLQFPSEAEWSGLWRPWSPAQAVQFDLSCLPCCSGACCADLPSTLTATITATTGGCTMGGSTTLTKSGSTWIGSIVTCQTLGLTYACTEPIIGDITHQVTTNNCPVGGTSAISGVETCLPQSFTFTVDAADPGCTCCPGGGTWTVTISE